MARTTHTQNTIETLGLDIDHRGINLIEEDTKIAIRYMKDGTSLSKIFTINDFNSMPDALRAADSYNRYIREVGKHPGTTTSKMIEIGIPLEEDIRCIRYIGPNKDRKQAYWDVRQVSLTGKGHRKLFSFEEGNKIDSRKSLQEAIFYRKEIMGDLLKVNPKSTRIQSYQTVISDAKNDKLIKNVSFHKTKEGIKVAVNVQNRIENIGIAKNWKKFKSLVKKAIGVRNGYLGLEAKAAPIEPVAASLRRKYLSLAGL